MLRFYFEVARTAYRRQLIYRWANLAGLLTNIFFGAIFSYVMIALFHARPVAAGFNVRDALRYIWLLQAMVMVVLTFGWSAIGCTDFRNNFRGYLVFWCAPLSEYRKLDELTEEDSNGNV